MGVGFPDADRVDLPYRSSGERLRDFSGLRAGIVGILKLLVLAQRDRIVYISGGSRATERWTLGFFGEVWKV